MKSTTSKRFTFSYKSRSYVEDALEVVFLVNVDDLIFR